MRLTTLSTEFENGFMPLTNGVIGVDPGFASKLHYMVSPYPQMGPDDGVRSIYLFKTSFLKKSKAIDSGCNADEKSGEFGRRFCDI